MCSSARTMNPHGGVMGRREAARPSLDVNLLERVLEPGNMRRAWRQVKANKGAPGVDGVTVDDWPKLAREQYESCLLYTSPSPRDRQKSRMPSSA